MTSASKNTLLPILLSCLGYFCYNISDAAVKYLGDRYHFSQIVLFTFTIMIVFVSIGGYLREGKAAFVMHKKKLVCLRAAMALVVGALNVYIMPYVQLTTFYTLVFTSPFMVAVLSALLLKEKLLPRQIAAVVVGFTVILFIFKPGAGLFSVYALLGLLSAFIYSLSVIVMRKIGPQESVTVMVNTCALFSIVTMIPLVAYHYVSPPVMDYIPFLLMGTMGGLGIYCISYAYQHAVSAASIAPYHYTQIFYGALIGYFMFDEVPSLSVIIGASLIVASGISLIYAESRAAKKKDMLTITESMAELPRD